MIHPDAFPTFRATARVLGRGRRIAAGLTRVCWRFMAPVMAAGLLMALGAYLAVNAMAGRELERELALIRQRGEPLTLAEAAPPPVPDAENAALVYDEAFLSLPRLEKPRSYLAAPKAPSQDPMLSREDDRVLGDFFSEKPRIRDQVSLQQVRKVLAGSDEALALARKAAAMPRCRFPVNWEAGAGALFPHYAQLRSLTRLLAARAVVAATDGDTAEAFADLEAVVGIARHCGSDPILIGQLVEYACLSIGHRAQQRVLEVASPGEAESRRLYQALAQVELYAPFEQTMQTERCFGIWGFEQWRRDPMQFFRQVSGGDEPPPFARPALLGRLSAPIIKMDQTFNLRYMAERISLAQQRRPVPPERLTASESDIPLYFIVSKMILPIFSQAYRKRDEAITGVGMAQTALALHVFRQREGAYPERLQSLEALSGWTVPNDPFTEQPFVYRRQGQGYLLYSVGVNGVDDGGENARTKPRTSPAPGSPVPPSTPGTPGVPPPEEDDLAWRVSG